MGYFATEQANVSASTKTANLLAGEQLEFIGDVPQMVSLYAVASASGVNINFFADNDVIADDQEIVNIGTTVNRSDHLIARDVVGAGTRLFLTLREVDGTATTDVLLVIETDPA